MGKYLKWKKKSVQALKRWINEWVNEWVSKSVTLELTEHLLLVSQGEGGMVWGIRMSGKGWIGSPECPSLSLTNGSTMRSSDTPEIPRVSHGTRDPILSPVPLASRHRLTDPLHHLSSICNHSTLFHLYKVPTFCPILRIALRWNIRHLFLEEPLLTITYV